MIFLIFWLLPVGIVALIKFVEWVQSIRAAPPLTNQDESILIDVPYYVYDQLNAHENKLDTLIVKLNYLQEQEANAIALNNAKQIIDLSNKVAQCKVQIAREEETIYKLINKWGI